MKYQPVNIDPYEDYHSHPLNHPNNERFIRASEVLRHENESLLHEPAILGPDVHHLSDEQMAHRIREILSSECGIDLNKVEIKVFEGDVGISGVVPLEKLPLITEKIEKAGARDIQNLLRAEENLKTAAEPQQ